MAGGARRGEASFATGGTAVSHGRPALVVLLCLLVLCCGCQPQPGTAEHEPDSPAPDAPALVVGDTVLTVAEVAPALERVLLSESLLLQNLPVDLARARLAQTLEASYQALIDEQLLLAEARRRVLAVDQAEVEKRIAGLREGMPDLYQMVVELEGLEGYRTKLRLLLLRQAAERSVIADQAGLCLPGETPTDEVLLGRWLVLARSRTPVEILWRPGLLPYLPSGAPQGGGS